MVPRKQHLRHRMPVPYLRTGILRILQQAIPVAFLLERRFIRQHPWHHPANRVRNRHRRDFPAGQHEIAN